MNTEPTKVKRFYKIVSIAPCPEGYGILLDGRSAKTTGRNILAAPTSQLAAAVSAEWDAQQEHMNRSSMRLTGILSAALDGGSQAAQEWCDEILQYLGSDLICYRADSPQALSEKQAAVWDPYIDFMRREFDVELVSTAGIIAVEQAEATFASVRQALEKQPSELLFALRIATAITGSTVLALALWRKESEPDAIFEASRVDERFQEERWGVDEEAKAREEGLRDDLYTANQFISLLG